MGVVAPPPLKPVSTRVITSLSTYPVPRLTKVTVAEPSPPVTTLNVAPVPEPVDDA